MTAKIHNLKQEREDRTPHRSGPAKCLQCAHIWEAVQPVTDGCSDTWLECPSCGLFKGTWMGPCFRESGNHLFKCRCGNTLFTLYADGIIMCPLCGVHHQPW